MSGNPLDYALFFRPDSTRASSMMLKKSASLRTPLFVKRITKIAVSPTYYISRFTFYLLRVSRSLLCRNVFFATTYRRGLLGTG